jgi:hypothetical protein
MYRTQENQCTNSTTALVFRENCDVACAHSAPFIGGRPKKKELQMS